MNFDLRSY